ncbi:7-deoxyloganetic acid glucosyltransferase-like [Lycium barbarum]|uniref:7-deoxyloganetic acid glucosyltransferase-like n=1 Tax=Lycium barbarum TaxID=112863 RepID=UPI00293EA426|nr:7-deoxyloganetic acid glucosyltransferase-like [Lycium barbarum]
MANPQPHVVMLPFPAQGHIKPMLMLAEVLCHAGFRISFVNTDHIHNIIVENIDKSPLSQFPGFRFLSIPDGLPPEHPRDSSSIKDLFTSINSTGKIMFRDLIISLLRRDDLEREEIWHAPCCIIADGIMSTLAIDVEEELEMPVITFRTYSATCTWVYFHLEKLIEQKEIPVREGDEDIDRLVTCITELEKVLRRRDLPSICRCEVDPSILKFFLEQTSKMRRASGLILNTFEDLEAPIIRQLHSIYSKVYTIGPLQALLKSQMDDSPVAGAATGSLRQEDRTCIAWLDKQPAKSVIYVSFGSVVVMSPDQILEFWHGLINSGKPFLWVIRPDLVFGNGPNGLPEEIMCPTNERGYVVSWAPQEEVLAHCAVGGFLTHSGWNSTLESITVGVPMICWPLIVDQKVNSRCVSDIWRVGIDMKDSCDRSTVERMVRVLMEDKDEEIAKSTSKFANLAQKSVREGGSSFCNINKLIEDIRSIQSKKDDCKTK